LLITTCEMFSVNSETRVARRVMIGTPAQPQPIWSDVPSTELVLP
jgi:hypothetical protein